MRNNTKARIMQAPNQRVSEVGRQGLETLEVEEAAHVDIGNLKQMIYRARGLPKYRAFNKSKWQSRREESSVPEFLTKTRRGKSFLLLDSITVNPSK